jgi:hypothetical protein
VRTDKPLGPNGAVAWAVGLAILMLAGAAILFRFDPSAARGYPPCPLHFAAGLYCPGCGSLRALHQLLHGHLARAFALNPLMVLALPALAFLRLRPSLLYRPWLAWSCFVLLLTYGLARNLACWPFVLLAPR